MMACIRLLAPNDRNGNPRRLGVRLRVSAGNTDIAEVIDEGYGGMPKDCDYGPAFHVTPGEYRRTLKGNKVVLSGLLGLRRRRRTRRKRRR